MNSNSFLIGFIPLIAFVIIDSFSTRKSALYSAVVLAIVEVGYTIYEYGTVDELSIISVLLVMVLAFLSLKKDTDLWFKLQPTILGIFFFAAFIFFYYVLDKPIMNYMVEKYITHDFHKRLPPGFSIDLFQEYLRRISRDLGWVILAHALITGYAALRLSKWWWITIRTLGFYLMLGLGMLAEMFFLRAH